MLESEQLAEARHISADMDAKRRMNPMLGAYLRLEASPMVNSLPSTSALEALHGLRRQLLRQRDVRELLFTHELRKEALAYPTARKCITVHETGSTPGVDLEHAPVSAVTMSSVKILESVDAMLSVETIASPPRDERGPRSALRRPRQSALGFWRAHDRDR